ncbi:MAG TPA: phosphoethanolamine--lipid A transferase [Telluria sp.]|nr:phosphoethanolamine--lipid A transferase [Telluria sp.]
MKLPVLPRVAAHSLTLIVAVFLAAVPNQTFWHHFVAATDGAPGVQLASFVVVAMVFNMLLSVASLPYLQKPVLMLILVCSAAASYFVDRYGVQIDKAMIQNVVETDMREATELFNLRFVATLLLLGALPALLVARTPVHYDTVRRQAVKAGGWFLLSLAIAAALLFAFSKTLAPALREHRELRFLLAPTNYLQAVNGYVRQKLAQPVVVAPLGTDALRGPAWTAQGRRTVTVIVVGETARAVNFSLNGYARNTNPELARQDGLVNFSNVESCGSATAVSVPCVFSALGRGAYSDSKARSQEGLLDVLSHAGFRVVWRDNNSGCKGVCDRVERVDVSVPVAGNAMCGADECYDERLLAGLPDLIRSSTRDLVVVLHQKGSHGPDYYKRYPARYARFGPVCETNELEKCERAAIVAAYDNSILYTDHVLSSAIDLLREAGQREDVDTALLYFSDHGESLGEKSMYLHGAPMIVAPSEQTHVPMMLWMSDRFAQRFHIDQRCLSARSAQPFSHDNVFHSVLGMLNVSTAVYDSSLDLIQACTRGA